MAGRPATGEGSRYRRASDGRWVGAVRLGYRNGKWQLRVVYGDTQREVLAKLQQLRIDSPMRPVRGRQAPQCLNEFLDRWLRAVAPSPAGPAVTSYESLRRSRVRPVLGGCPLDQLGVLQLQELPLAIQGSGRSGRTTQMVH